MNDIMLKFVAAEYLKDVSEISNIKKPIKKIIFLLREYRKSFFGQIIRKLHISAIIGI